MKKPSGRAVTGNRAAKRALMEMRKRHALQSRTGNTPPPNDPPKHRQTVGEPKRKKRWALRIFLVIIALFIVGSGVFGYQILAASNKITVSDRSILGQLKDLLLQDKEALGGELDGRINILLIAIGGEGHSGVNLADTIMVASIKPETKEVALLSIPRDLYVQVPDEEYYTKINAVHAHGESIKEDNGPELLKRKVEEITGQPIHYYGRVDFIAFKHIIDAVGGVNIVIDNTFLDYWHNITFSEGTEKMDGERALAYARARYVEGPEGGDFKRAARQQQVLLSLREKIFSVQTALDFTALNNILNSVSDNVRTDLELWELKRLYELARDINPDQVESVVLTTGPNGVLTGGTEILGGTPASILRPRTGNFAEIQSIAENIFQHAGSSDTSSKPVEVIDEPTPTPQPEVTVEIRNGTNITGLASKISTILKDANYKVADIGNAENRETKETTVYVLKVTKSSDGQAIAETLNANTSTDLPENETESSADIVIILGPDAESIGS